MKMKRNDNFPERRTKRMSTYEETSTCFLWLVC